MCVHVLRGVSGGWIYIVGVCVGGGVGGCVYMCLWV